KVGSAQAAAVKAPIHDTSAEPRAVEGAAAEPAPMKAASMKTAAVEAARVAPTVPAALRLGLTGAQEQCSSGYGCRSEKRCEFVEHGYLISVRVDLFRWTCSAQQAHNVGAGTPRSSRQDAWLLP